MKQYYQVVGNSMYPTLSNGDVIEIKSDNYRDNDIVVAKTKDKKLIVKRLRDEYLVGDNIEVSLNYNKKDIEIIGKYVKKVNFYNNFNITKAYANTKTTTISKRLIYNGQEQSIVLPTEVKAIVSAQIRFFGSTEKIKSTNTVKKTQNYQFRYTKAYNNEASDSAPNQLRDYDGEYESSYYTYRVYVSNAGQCNIINFTFRGDSTVLGSFKNPDGGNFIEYTSGKGETRLDQFSEFNNSIKWYSGGNPVANLWVEAELMVFYYPYIYTHSQNASVTLNGTKISSPNSNLSEGGSTAWQPLSSFKTENNTIKANVGGSGKVYYEIQYTYTTNENPDISLNTTNNQTILEGQILLNSNPEGYSIKFKATDTNSQDTLQYKIIQNNLTQVEWTFCPKDIEINYVFRKLNLGNNTCQIIVKDSSGGETTRNFIIRNKAIENSSAKMCLKGVREVMDALAYSGNNSSCFNDLKPSDFNGDLCLAELLNSLK